MAYDEHLAERITRVLKERKASHEAKKMMGGLCFMVNDKMCVGIIKDQLMARVGPHIYDEVIQEDGCRPMDFTGRPMKGYVYVTPEAVDLEVNLEKWIDRCLDFNPEAKASKKKKKSV